MPLFSDHISNMYYSGSSSYTNSPYSYSSAIPTYGSSYSASYLNPGGNYSSHSSLGGYSRAPLSSRWLTSSGRAYSPMLSTISEKGTSSPVRINSPRRIPISGRTYVSSTYSTRPININTADIDVSRDKYRNKTQYYNSTLPTSLPPRRESPLTNKETGHDKPDTGIDKSPGPKRSTIKRDRTVVRLHTVKRKERDSPRKPIEVSNTVVNNDSFLVEKSGNETDSKKWREKLAEDLAYKTQKEKKTLGAKLVEKFTLKEKNEEEHENCIKTSSKSNIDIEKISLKHNNDDCDVSISANKSFDRRCSMELLAEQASLLDSLIRRENLSTAPLDISKLGSENMASTDMRLEPQDTKKRKLSRENCLSTTKSDHSLHDRLSSKDVNDPLLPKRRSLRKCYSSGNVQKLDCIKERSKKPIPETKKPSIKDDVTSKNKKIKPKIKTKITSTVEITSTTPQLKFIVENVTVEETSRPCKKEIIFSSKVEENSLNDIPSKIETSKEEINLEKGLKPKIDMQVDLDIEKTESNMVSDNISPDVPELKTKEHRKSIKSKSKDEYKAPQDTSGNLTSPEPEDGNFWEKIGKRETVYLIKRKHNLEKAKEQSIKTLFWFPEEENVDINAENNDNVDCNLLKDVNLVEKNDEMIDNIIPTKKNQTAKPHEEEKKPNLSLEIKDTKKEVLKNTPQDVTSPENTISQSKISKSNKDNKIQQLNLKISDKNINDHNTTVDDTVISNIISNKIDNIAENTKNINNPNDTKVTDDSHHEKILSTDNPKTPQNLSSFQANITASNTEGKPMVNTEKITKSIKSTKELRIDTESTETTISSVEVPAKLSSSKNSQKDDVKTISINTGTLSSAMVNTSEILNIPDPRTIDSSTSKNSLKQTNKNIESTKKEEANPEQRDVDVLSFCNSQNELTAKIGITCTETSEEGPGESTVTNCNVNMRDNQDSKTNVEGICVNFEKKHSNDKKETNVETEEIIINTAITNKDANKLFTNIKPAKEEKALKPLIATPRPLQKRNPQTIRSSPSSSSEEDSSDEETDEDANNDERESGSSHGSTEYVECENHPDGRTSTGSNDSGFDSSAPTSPSGFQQAKKDCDVNCHRKCEKLTANLCGVNQRLLVEALASRTTSKRGGDPSTSAGVTSPQTFSQDILEQELEQSTAYDLFRKTGRFTPPARSIPRFRKYTIEDFQFIRVLGKGSFGKVMLAELRDTEYYYAVKCLKKDVVLEDDDVECTLIERKVLALGTNHPYLCHLFATFQTDSHLFFVMEYLNGGDLMFHIQQSGRFPEPRARFYAAEIVSGLKFLHKRGIVYRDLKLDNILLDFDGHVRIADFGMCKLQIYLDKTADTFCGTPDYMAPEIIKGLKYNQTVDWWSFGVLLYEMLIGQSPFSGCDEDELFWSICNEMPSYPRFLSPESLSILTRLLDKDARTRLGGPECMHGDIRDQKFFEQIHWDRLERRELETPFKPRVRHPMDTQYFDRAFTGERPRLTAVEPQVLRSMDQEPFRGFSYTNPNATDR